MENQNEVENYNEKNQEDKDKAKDNIKTNSRKKIQIPHFKMHSEMDSLRQVALQAERVVLFMINTYNYR